MLSGELSEESCSTGTAIMPPKKRKQLAAAASKAAADTVAKRRASKAAVDAVFHFRNKQEEGGVGEEATRRKVKLGRPVGVIEKHVRDKRTMAQITAAESEGHCAEGGERKRVKTVFLAPDTSLRDQLRGFDPERSHASSERASLQSEIDSKLKQIELADADAITKFVALLANNPSADNSDIDSACGSLLASGDVAAEVDSLRLQLQAKDTVIAELEQQVVHLTDSKLSEITPRCTFLRHICRRTNNQRACLQATFHWHPLKCQCTCSWLWQGRWYDQIKHHLLPPPRPRKRKHGRDFGGEWRSFNGPGAQNVSVARLGSAVVPRHGNPARGQCQPRWFQRASGGRRAHWSAVTTTRGGPAGSQLHGGCQKSAACTCAAIR